MKNTILILTLAFIFLGCNNINAQKDDNKLYINREYKEAYEKGTRNFDGKPGNNYFQNKTDYQIKAEFFTETGTVVGEEIITYKNNSPDELDKIVLHLYPNLYKKGNLRDWNIGTIDLHDGVELTNVEINDKKIEINAQNAGTILTIPLDENLKPNSEIKLKINWSYILPKQVTIRQGTYHETAFFVAFWFPKIAVYDDIYGWNTNPYSGMQEFYHEYGDYDVEISVSGEYLVWSSGILQNSKELLQPKIYDKFIEAKKSNAIINIITKEDIENKQILNSTEKNTWKFKAKNLPDFAFALSDKFLWDGTTAKAGDKQTFVSAVYSEKSKDFFDVAEISKQVIEAFSEPEILGYHYPYPQMTVFNGGGGMEFPMMVNDGSTRNYEKCVHLTAHEITHSFFPFYVGTNENTSSWMDEGLVTFLPKKIEKKLSKKENIIPFKDVLNTYNQFGGTKHDLPIMTPTNQEKGRTYRFLSYYKPAVAMYILRDYLGEEVFYKCMQEFIARWNGKHPSSYDFFYTFNNISGENLNWFWKQWFFSFAYADLAIGNISENNTKIEIINKGGLPIPIKLTAIYKDNSSEQFYYKADVWKNKNHTYYITIKKDIKELKLDTETLPDVFDNDNFKNYDR